MQKLLSNCLNILAALVFALNVVSSFYVACSWSFRSWRVPASFARSLRQMHEMTNQCFCECVRSIRSTLESHHEHSTIKYFPNIQKKHSLFCLGQLSFCTCMFLENPLVWRELINRLIAFMTSLAPIWTLKLLWINIMCVLLCCAREPIKSELLSPALWCL